MTSRPTDNLHLTASVRNAPVQPRSVFYEVANMACLAPHCGPLAWVRLGLSVLACNLGNLWRPVLPRRIDGWSLTSLQERLLKRTRHYSSRRTSQARGQRFRRRKTDLRICEHLSSCGKMTSFEEV